MWIDVETTRHLEELARIELAPRERETFAAQLDRVVEFARQLQETGAKAPPPAGTAAGRPPGPLRPDIPDACLDRDAVLERAPVTDEHAVLFCVPRVIER